MASICRSAATAGSRSAIAVRSKTLISRSQSPKSMPSLFSSPSRTAPRASILAMALGSVESLMPLHSAIASARLKSILADSSRCWSCLSQAKELIMANIVKNLRIALHYNDPHEVLFKDACMHCYSEQRVLAEYIV
ncbi:hypothetical protein Scep_020639 [Stephania cephalantha]|uniref:Uncharacterized protein n=1 Tax=Stephania cephalantha TaxID=152367 RepID=A0AAP0ID69_9MAGN